MNEDTERLRQFADEGSQAAFAALVRGKIDLVYAAALRQVGGDAHLAQDVTQGVFLALACQAGALKRHAVLTGWLYTTTRFLAAKAVRAQSRWQRREQEANPVSTSAQNSEPAWAELRPIIDTAMHELGEKDRAALLLRFFEGRSLAEVGAAIGLAENSARMRVERALEKLRGRLARHGITSTAAALSTALAAQPATTLPASLAASVTGSALVGASLGGAGALGTATWIFHFMSTTKLLLGSAAALAVLGLGAYLGANIPHENFPPAPTGARAGGGGADGSAAMRAENQRLRIEIGRTAARAVPVPAGTPVGGRVTAPVSPTALEALRVLTDLQGRKLVTPDLNLVTEEGKTTGIFRELFALTEAEQATLQGAMQTARAKAQALERENTTVTRAPNGEVNLEVKAFPEAGGAAYDGMLKIFADTLGEERYRAFLALGAEQTEKALGRFGTTVQAVTVSKLTGDDGEILYRIHARASSPPHDNWNYSSDLLTAERFQKEAASFLPLLPGDFLPRK